MSLFVRSLKKFVAIVFALALIGSSPPPHEDGIGDFFARIGRTLSKLRKPTPTPTPAKARAGGQKMDAGKMTRAASPSPSSPPPTPTPIPVDIRPAVLAPPSSQKRDVPYAIAVPNKPGLVTSPYAPGQGFVDVHAFPSSTEVLDPFTGKIFRTP